MEPGSDDPRRRFTVVGGREAEPQPDEGDLPTEELLRRAHTNYLRLTEEIRLAKQREANAQAYLTESQRQADDLVDRAQPLVHRIGEALLEDAHKEAASMLAAAEIRALEITTDARELVRQVVIDVREALDESRRAEQHYVSSALRDSDRRVDRSLDRASRRAAGPDLPPASDPPPPPPPPPPAPVDGPAPAEATGPILDAAPVSPPVAEMPAPAAEVPAPPTEEAAPPTREPAAAAEHQQPAPPPPPQRAAPAVQTGMPVADDDWFSDLWAGVRNGEPLGPEWFEPAEPARALQPDGAGGERPNMWAPPAGRECPDGHPVKVKCSSGLYHVPGMFAYERTVADRCYPDERSAEADGFRRARR